MCHNINMINLVMPFRNYELLNTRSTAKNLHELRRIHVSGGSSILEGGAPRGNREKVVFGGQCRSAEGATMRGPKGGPGACPPWKIFTISMQNGALWRHFNAYFTLK